MSQLTLPATAPAMPVMRGARVIHDIVINADTHTHTHTGTEVKEDMIIQKINK